MYEYQIFYFVLFLAVQSDNMLLQSIATDKGFITGLAAHSLVSGHLRPLPQYPVSRVYRTQLVETARLLPVVWEQAQQVQGPELGLAHRGQQQLELSAQQEQLAAVLAEVVPPAAADAW